MNGGFQKTKDFFPLGEPSFCYYFKVFSRESLACSFGLAIVAEERMICGFAW